MTRIRKALIKSVKPELDLVPVHTNLWVLHPLTLLQLLKTRVSCAWERPPVAVIGAIRLTQKLLRLSVSVATGAPRRPQVPRVKPCSRGVHLSGKKRQLWSLLRRQARPFRLGPVREVALAPAVGKHCLLRQVAAGLDEAFRSHQPQRLTSVSERPQCAGGVRSRSRVLPVI